MQIEHSLLNKIHEIEESEGTGLLHLEKEGQQIVLSFQQGRIAAAGSSASTLQLGKILSLRGILQIATIPKLLVMAKRKRQPIGKMAVLQKLLDEPGLKEAVRDQVVQAVAHAMARDYEIGSFQDAAINLYIPAELDLENLILELARNNLRPVRLDPSRMIALNNGRSLSHLPWFPQELSVLSQLKTPRTLQDLAITTGMEYERLNKILCVFDSLRLLKQVDAPPSESTAIMKRDGFPYMHLTPEIQSSGLSDKLETFHNPSSFVSEQFKNLKVRIAEMPAPIKVISVSSPQAEDGKSLISVNLALSFSKESGKRAILVDCDLRNPSLHKFLGTSAEPGLIGYLESDYLQPYCYVRRLDKMFFMTAGGTSENPVELLSNERMQRLIADLKVEFDTVILDCPPFGPISDAQILTGLADGLLMVMRRGRTTYGAMEKAFRNFVPSKLIGLVFNDVKPMMFNTQYHYKYYKYSGRAYPYSRAKKSFHPKTYLD